MSIIGTNKYADVVAMVNEWMLSRELINLEGCGSS